MNRKVILIATIATLLLLPSTILILPLNAKAPIKDGPPGATIGHGQGTYEVWLVNEGKVWKAGDILNMKDSYFEGPHRTQWVKSLSLNLETGHGTFRVKWVTAQVIEGMAARGIITDMTHISGTYVCHGTGNFEQVNLVGTFEGEIQYNAEGLPDYMRFEETGIMLVPPSSPIF
jgi:hypothetical protein